MRYISLILGILTLLSCSQDRISYNPFAPNYDIDLKTVLDNGFNLSFSESLSCYEKTSDNFRMYFLYDYKEKKIVGEGYFFEIGSISTRSDSIQDKILNLDLDHDFDASKYKIEKLLDKFNSSIISTISHCGASKDLTFFARDQIYNRIVECNLIYTPDFKEGISLETFYPTK
jgi:hypothetical protein